MEYMGITTGDHDKQVDLKPKDKALQLKTHLESATAAKVEPSNDKKSSVY